MKQINKKAQVMQNLGAIGVGIVALTLVLVIVFLMTSIIRTQNISVGISSSVTNETVVWTNNTFVTLDFSPNSMELSCSALYNGTGGGLIGSGNYTCDTGGINVINISYPANTSLILSYTHKQTSAAYNSTTNLTSSAATIPGWVPLIILVMIGGMILLMVKLFGNQ